MKINFYRLSIGAIAISFLAGIIYIALNWYVPYWYKQQYTVAVAPGTPRILLVWYRGIGEQETIARIKIAAARSDIVLKVVTTKPRFYIRWFVKDAVAAAREALQPDFLLTIQDWIEYYPGVPNYMTLTLGTARYLIQDANGQYEFINPQHQKFDALLPSFKDNDQLQLAYEKNGKRYKGFAWYPTSYATDYPAAVPKKLFYSGGFLWDKTRGSQKYKELFSKLDQAGYFAVCGPKKKWRHTPNSAIGFIPVDGTSLIAAHHTAGITLLLHTQLHLHGGAPTGRIFEAAAANTVIISDLHPFIQKYFGDNVLYIDTQQDAAGMFKQINDHMNWIYAHPQQAQQMAENCHNIFLQRFSMEQQLAKLIDLHQTATLLSAHLDPA